MHRDDDDAVLDALQHLRSLREYRNQVQHADGSLRGRRLPQHQEIQVSLNDFLNHLDSTSNAPHATQNSRSKLTPRTTTTLWRMAECATTTLGGTCKMPNSG